VKILPYLLQAVESASLDIVGPLVSFLLQNRTYVEGNVNRPKKKEAKFFFPVVFSLHNLVRSLLHGLSRRCNALSSRPTLTGAADLFFSPKLDNKL